jgi:hypothetical protein
VKNPGCGYHSGRADLIDHEGRVIVASEHTVADDIVYDLISIQYHALKGAELYDRFLNDAHSAEHDDVTKFIRQCKEEDERRAVQAHELLGTLTRSHGIG